jgi:DNA repair protein RecO (recombination protein O)
MKGSLYEFYILHQKKYKENSLLITIFTKEFGKISAISRVSKKQQNLYQPIVLMKGELSLSKQSDGLSKVFNIESISSYYNKSYIVLISIQYINELLYILISYSHEEEQLFKKYDFIIQNINDENYTYMLRMFEIELLHSLGQSIFIDKDINGNKILDESIYDILPLHGFRLSKLDYGIKGTSINKIYSSMLLWSDNDLKNISKIMRLNINACLNGRELKSRKLLIDYLFLKSKTE